MKILQFVGWTYVVCLAIFIFFLAVGYIFENKISDNSPWKKWWRRNIIGIAPNDVDI